MRYGKTLLAVAVALMMLAVPCIVAISPASVGESISNDKPSDHLEYQPVRNGDGEIIGLMVTGIDYDNAVGYEVEIPTSHEYETKEYPVIQISPEWGSGAFAGCIHLKKVVIPNTITFIGQSSFSGCSALEKVYIPSSVKQIRQNAFDGCVSLDEVTFQETDSNDAELYMNGYAFCGCVSLKTVNLPKHLVPTMPSAYQNNVTEGLFCGCTSMTEITVTQGNNFFFSTDGVLFCKHDDGGGEKVYLIECPHGKKLTDGQYIVPDNVDVINTAAFNDLSSLKSLQIGDNVSKIGKGAFQNCVNLETITVADGNNNYLIDNGGALVQIESSGENTLHTFPAANTKVKEYVSDCTNIYPSAFDHCEGLTSVKMDNLKTFPHEEYGDHCCTCFAGCMNLASVSFAKVDNMPSGTFEGCKHLKTVNIPSVADYKFTLYGKEYQYGIGKHAFKGCESLASIRIPDGVTMINDNAFEGCTKLSSIDFNKVVSIDSAAFKGCTGFTGKMSLPENLKEISPSIFEGCTGLSEVVIPDKLTTVADSAFKGCASLTKINLKKITEVKRDSFMGCSSLSSVDFTSMETIRDTAFKDCKALDGIKFFESASIGASAFEGCTSLKNLNLDGVIYIGRHAFRGCIALETVNIAQSVNYIGDSPFNGCQNLTEITVAGMNFHFTSENGVLYKVDNIQKKETLIQYPCGKAGISFTIPDDVRTVGTEAIVGTKLASLTIGKDVTKIDANGIGGNKSLTEILVATGNNEFKTVNDALYDRNNNLIQYPSGRTDKEINLESCNRIESGALSGCTSVKKITIRNDIVFRGNPFTDCASLKEIVVSNPGETGLYSDGGMLYSREVKAEVGKLVVCPAGIEVFKPKDGTSAICDYALNGCVFTSIELPESVTYIGPNAFFGMAFYKNDKTTSITDYSLLLGKKYLLMESNDGLLKYYEAGPDVTDVEPQEGSASKIDTVTVSGKTVDGSKVTISVNGGTPEEVTVTGGLFSKDVKLTKLGEYANTIVIVAEKDGLKTEITRHVYYSPAEPTISITSPTSGTTVDNSTIEVKGTVTNAVKVTIKVNGTAVGDITPTGNVFSKTVTLSEGKNTIVAIAIGADGKTVTSSTVTVTYEDSPEPVPTPSSDDGMAIVLSVVFFFVVLGVICIATYPGKK